MKRTFRHSQSGAVALIVAFALTLFANLVLLVLDGSIRTVRHGRLDAAVQASVDAGAIEVSDKAVMLAAAHLRPKQSGFVSTESLLTDADRRQLVEDPVFRAQVVTRMQEVLEKNAQASAISLGQVEYRYPAASTNVFCGGVNPGLVSIELQANQKEPQLIPEWWSHAPQESHTIKVIHLCP